MNNGTNWRASDVTARYLIGQSNAGPRIAEAKKIEPGAQQPDESQGKWRWAREVVADIVKHKNDPIVELRLGGDVLTRLELGGILLLIGGTGRGKTSLAACLLVEHARDIGPAIACSLELPDRQWLGRAIGTRCDASWSGVLHGEVDEARMRQVVPERLMTIDRKHASLSVLRDAIAAAKAAYPNQPILVAVDYVQLAESETGEDIRMNIGRVMRDLDGLTRDAEWVVSIALSQGSRNSARALSSDEKLGAETVDTGAESAALERWASVQLAIGKLGPVGDDGSKPVGISIGKSRMDELGDSVRPARYWGKSGLWRLAGDARPATEVRAEVKAKEDSRAVETLIHAMRGWAEGSKEPFTATEIERAVTGNNGNKRTARQKLIDSGEIVQVHQKRKGSSHWLLWPPTKAQKAGLLIVAAEAQK